ncbi:hypothetical protein CGC58_04410 [Capnocytophaga stomatis]|uniref:Uncharacterized protein n=2 Tax=Capnocytophaga stomatis TaxID=1848904 RepID=A0A250FV36_9FLAO|nr:hypothetical protein CGC58_04410 [Capnocytophaga stomatis]
MALAIVSTGAYAQAQDRATKGTAPTQNVNCVDNAQNPIVGKKYTYTVDGPEGKYHFFATNNTTFINDGNLLTTGAYTEGGGQIKVTTGSYNDANSESKSIELAWTNVAGTSYLVVNHTPKANCTTANNLKVLKIQPKNAFFIELRNMNNGKQTQASSALSNVEVCLGTIKSAEIEGDQVAYNYGEQSLFYELTAVNYDKSFVPQIKLEGLKTGQTATLKWGYNRDNISQVLKTINVADINQPIDFPEIVADELIDPSEGVSIYLELVINNGKEEGLVDQPITLLADATTGINKNIKDVKVTDCSEENDFADKAIQTLKARATVTAGTGLQFISPKP